VPVGREKNGLTINLVEFFFFISSRYLKQLETAAPEIISARSKTLKKPKEKTRCVE
jgi:hypothetical protein